MTEAEIQEFVQQARDGDAEAFGVLFEEFSDRVYRFLAMRVSEKETAEDITQTVFVEMIQSLGRYKKQRNAKFSTWLFQIARFRLIDHYRSKKAHIPLEDVPEPVQEPAHADPVQDRALRDALNTLPEQQRTVLHLHFFEDMSPQEIAVVLKTTAINVRVIQHRAIKVLRTLITI
ncbi:MAG: sigma-70 family RNA polymerase sigma factor [Patescibacteria group bacterium]|jgi:RNA polymerase sigma-70 factor (ECF subfamily)